MDLLVTLIIIGVPAVVLASAAIKIIPEYQRGVMFRLGRLVGAMGPGLVLMIPVVDRMVRVDLRTYTQDVPSQQVITQDNVSVAVNAVVYFRVMQPEQAVVQVQDYAEATTQVARTTLRSVLGQGDLDYLLSKRDEIAERIQEIIDRQTDPWGVKVTSLEIREVELPDAMQRAMAQQAERERERRAKVIAAEGEYQAAGRVAEAAVRLDRSPTALRLRYLQNLAGIAAEGETHMYFPVPIAVVSPHVRARQARRARRSSGSA